MDQPDSVITNMNQISRAGTQAEITNRNKSGVAKSNNSVASDSTNKASKRPKNTALKQQRLPAWQPILTAKTVLPLFFAIGVIFVVLGGVLLHFSDVVQETVIDYTDCNSVGTSTACSTIATPTTTCYCQQSFTLTSDYSAPVYFYYGLKNFYQNHRRYVKSRDDNQLLGRAVTSVNSECSPFDKSGGSIYAPCGAIANSLFNDSFTVSYTGSAGQSTPVNVTTIATGIAWSSDKNVKFANPSSWTGTIKPVNWKLNAYQLGNGDPSNTGYQNEDLIVWMRTAALPTFRKFYRRVNHNDPSAPAFTSGLPAGKYTVLIDYNFPVTVFNGRKTFIVSTTSWLGGKNPFLGIAYLVVGSLCIVLGFVFLFIHFKFSRSMKPVDDLNNNKVTTAT